MKKLLPAAIFLALATPAQASDWRDEDTVREAVYLGLHAIDWAQTRTIAAHPEKYHEMNPVVGEHPSAGNVNRYFAATTLLHLGVAYALPPGWRAPFQYFSIGAVGATVMWNVRAGIRVEF